MPSPPEMPPLPPTVDPRWRRVVWLAALISLLFLWAPWVVGAVVAKTPKILQALLICSPLWLPYAWILWRVRGKTPKKALALAMPLGGVFLLFALLFLLLWLKATAEVDAEVDWRVLGPVSLFALTQAALVIAAIKTYYSMAAEAGDARLLRRGFVIPILYAFALFILFGIALPGLLPPSHLPANQASAVASLRTINVAAANYQATYGNGFPSSLAALGPPAGGTPANCNAAELIDSLLASGQKHGYKIEYKPGPALEKPASGCALPGAKSYAVVARPLKYQKTGVRSIFTDESGVIRWTADDRPATAQDPPIS